MQLTDVLEEYVFDCELRKLSPRTIKSTRNNNTKQSLVCSCIGFTLYTTLENNERSSKKYTNLL